MLCTSFTSKVLLLATTVIGAVSSKSGGSTPRHIVPEPHRSLLAFPALNDVKWTPTSLLGECEGKCTTDEDCSDSLVCWDTGVDTKTEVPGCSGTSSINWDYCVDADAADEWTSTTTTWPPGTIKNVAFNGADDLNECEGDCDSDDDCSGSLVCWTDSGDIPGCTGDANAYWDYCVEDEITTGDDPSWGTTEETAPLTNLVWRGWSRRIDFLLGECAGDCSDDSDCRDGLVCFQNDGFDVPPGCVGTPRESGNYCYDPANALSEESGAVSFSWWPTEGKRWVEIPGNVSTAKVLMVAVLVLMGWMASRCCCTKKEQKSYRKVAIAEEMSSDFDLDAEDAQPMNV